MMKSVRRIWVDEQAEAESFTWVQMGLGVSCWLVVFRINKQLK